MLFLGWCLPPFSFLCGPLDPSLAPNIENKKTCWSLDWIKGTSTYIWQMFCRKLPFNQNPLSWLPVGSSFGFFSTDDCYAKVQKVEERLSALGNCIACNDYVGRERKGKSVTVSLGKFTAKGRGGWTPKHWGSWTTIGINHHSMQGYLTLWHIELLGLTIGVNHSKWEVALGSLT